MSETKTFVVPDNLTGNNDNLATMAMMNGGFGGGMWNNPFMYLVWMYIMRWMNNGYGDQCGDPAVQRQLQTLQDQMQDNHNSDLVMQAIKGNSQALQDLSTRLSCDANAIQSAIQSVQSSIANVGSQVGFSSERIINAVNNGDSGIIQALNNCCCSTQKEILKMGYENQINNQNQTYQLTSQLNGVNNVIQNGFRDTNYATQQQTCSLQNTIKDTTTINTNAILAKLDSISNTALQDKIQALREKNNEQATAINNAQQSALFGQMINAAVTPINNTLASLSKEVDGIQCKLPNTVTLPYSCATAIPTAMAYNLYGYNNYGAWA